VVSVKVLDLPRHLSEEGKMNRFMDKLNHTWELMKASFEVLKMDKELLLFPLFSGLCMIVVVASFIAVPFFTGALTNEMGEFAFPLPGSGSDTTMNNVIYYGYLFIFYFFNYFVIIYFNSAMVGCAKMRLMGDDPIVDDGFEAANSRIGSILGWAAISAVVGLVLRIIEDRSKTLGKIIAGLLGVAWSLTSFLVIPIIVIEGKGPIESFKESAAMLKKTWGEQIMSNIGFGLIFFLISIPFILLMAIGIAIGGVATPIVIVIFLLFWMLAGMMQSVLQAIFQTALYVYAKYGKAPQGFSAGLLDGTIVSK
jgi:Family of unknown function (DUF6159)